MANVYDYNQILKDLQSYWTTRKLALIKYWDFYYGDRQRFYLDMFEGETYDEYNKRMLTAAIENHCAKTCDVLVGYLYGQPEGKNRVVVRVVDGDGELVGGANQLLQKNVWRFNGMDSFRLKTALMSSVTGVGVVKKVFVDKRTKLPFNPLTSKEEKKKFGSVRYDLCDSVDTIPLPLQLENGDTYPNILGAIVRYYQRDNFSGITPLDRLLQKKYTDQEILEVYDGQKFIRAILQNGAPVPDMVTTVRNPYGSIDVVFTLFPNYGDSVYLEGASDLSQMMSLQNVLNEINNADKLTIDYHSYPVLVLTGGAKLPSNFVRKVNSALELDVNQDIKYLTWDNVLEASAAFKESVRKQMTVTSGVSQISRGNASDIGQVRSGAGLKTLFQADINAVGLKIPLFKRAEEELALSTLEMWRQETGESFGEELYVEVEFPSDFVGLDELLKAQTEQIDLSNRTRTIEEIVLAKHPEITTEEELAEHVAEALEQQKQIAISNKPPMTPKPQGTTQKSQEQQKTK